LIDRYRKIKKEHKRSSLQSNKGKEKVRTAPGACKPLEGAAPKRYRGTPQASMNSQHFLSPSSPPLFESKGAPSPPLPSAAAAAAVTRGGSNAHRVSPCYTLI